MTTLITRIRNRNRGAAIRFLAAWHRATVLVLFVAFFTAAPVFDALGQDGQAANDRAGSGLPSYRPEAPVSGVIRNFGSGLAGMIKLWEEGFAKRHPDVRFEDRLPTSDAAMSALITGVADLAPAGREPVLTETLAFYETFGHHVTAIEVASGSYDVEGMSPALVVYVHKDNPVTGLALSQLDGIFGESRAAAYAGFKWLRSNGRGAKDNIRTWGQVLGPAQRTWTNTPINTYGHAPSGTTFFFQLRAMSNGSKWNPNYREFVESGSKLIAADDVVRQETGVKHMLGQILAKDPNGIAWSIEPQARGIEGIRPVPLSATPGGPFITASRATVSDRSYPLARPIYIYINRPPGQPLDPKVREFLRYILSADGQGEIVKKGSYLPLPPSVIAAQLKKLD